MWTLRKYLSLSIVFSSQMIRISGGKIDDSNQCLIRFVILTSGSLLRSSSCYAEKWKHSFLRNTAVCSMEELNVWEAFVVLSSRSKDAAV